MKFKKDPVSASEYPTLESARSSNSSDNPAFVIVEGGGVSGTEIDDKVELLSGVAGSMEVSTSTKDDEESKWMPLSFKYPSTSVEHVSTIAVTADSRAYAPYGSNHVPSKPITSTTIFRLGLLLAVVSSTDSVWGPIKPRLQKFCCGKVCPNASFRG